MSLGKTDCFATVTIYWLKKVSEKKVPWPIKDIFFCCHCYHQVVIHRNHDFGFGRNRNRNPKVSAETETGTETITETRKSSCKPIFSTESNNYRLRILLKTKCLIENHKSNHFETIWVHKNTNYQLKRYIFPAKMLIFCGFGFGFSNRNSK